MNVEGTVNAKLIEKYKQVNNEELCEKLDETDEMKLKLLEFDNVPDNAEAIMYPKELNQHLISQLQTSSYENSQLRKIIIAKDQEIIELAKTTEMLNERIRDLASGTGPMLTSKSANIISAKITLLCKQNRNLTSQMESYKTKNSRLERKLLEAEDEMKVLRKLESDIEVINVCEAPLHELKILQDKLSDTSKNLNEVKNKNWELKNEVKTANKLLQQEIGENFSNIRDLSVEQVGWKGRAQQILVLQTKVVDLEERLNMKKKDSAEERKNESRLKVVRDIEIRKRKEAELAIKEMQVFKAENNEISKKLDGSRARIRILECEVTSLKQKIQIAYDKSDHDERFIDQQRNEMKNIERHYQNLLNESSNKINSLNDDLHKTRTHAENMVFKADALEKLANNKSEKIEELRQQLIKFEECSLQKVFFQPMKAAAENEIKILSDLVKSLNERLSTARKEHEDMERIYFKVREMKEVYRRKVIKLEMEYKVLKEAKSNKCARARSIPKDVITSDTSDMKEFFCNLEREDLNNKLELANEKFKMMKDKYKMLEDEKNEDFEELTRMIQTSKQLFSDAMATLQKDKFACND